MILVIILIAFAIVGAFSMRGMAEATRFDQGVQPLDVLERYVRRTAPILLLAALAIAIVARYAPQIAQPTSDRGVILTMLVVPVGAIILSYIRWVVPAMAARMARDEERLQRLLHGTEGQD